MITHVLYYRKLPCAKLTTYSPTLISNSLAFMSCVAGSEEQKELEALEALANKNALLDQARSIPIGEWYMYMELPSLGIETS